MARLTHTPASFNPGPSRIGRAADPAPHFWTPSTPEELAEADKRVKALVAEIVADLNVGVRR